MTTKSAVLFLVFAAIVVLAWIAGVHDGEIRAKSEPLEITCVEQLWFCTDCEQAIDLDEGFTITSVARRQGVCALCARDHWEYYGLGSEGSTFDGWMMSLREARVPWRSARARYNRTCCSCGSEFGGPLIRCRGGCNRPVCNDCGGDDGEGNRTCPDCLCGPND